MSDRIAAIVKVNQHTPASFADAIGVQRSSLSHILNGRNKPSLDFLQKVLAHFPRVDAAWLITGKHPTSGNPANGRPEEMSPQPEPISDPGTEVGIAAPTSQRVPSEEKRIERIVVFYTDRTFDTYDAS